MKVTRTRKAASLGAMLLAVVLTAAACSAPAATSTPSAAPAAAQTTTDPSEGYQTMSAKEAKQMLDTETDVTLVDVRELSEYEQGHIPNAKLLPLGSLSGLAADELPDKNAKIMVYCRSGSRSRMAARTLAGLGYTQVIDIGGILNWPYDIVRD